MRFTGGAVEKVSDSRGGLRELELSPDGSKLSWQANGGLLLHDLVRGTERALSVPGVDAHSYLLSHAWSPDSRRVAVVVHHQDGPEYGTGGPEIGPGHLELRIGDTVTGRWRRGLDLDARAGDGFDLVEMAWPAGSKRIAFVSSDDRVPVSTHRPMYVDPKTGRATPSLILARGRHLSLGGLQFDATGRYMLFGRSDGRALSTWWSAGAQPVLINRTRIGGGSLRELLGGGYFSGAW